MGKVRPQQETVRFACNCGYVFERAPDRVIDCDEDYHPWQYEAACPSCGQTSEQDPRQRNMFKMWARATGPKTPEGKAKSAANLEGHPTPEEAKRTRFNALKHGMNAEVATYFPARPGQYDACEGCPYRDNLCLDQVAKSGPCLQRTELFFQTHLAYETGDPSMLKGILARLQANAIAMIDSMFLAVQRRGYELESPEWYFDKDGEFHLAEFTNSQGERQIIRKVEANPLIKHLIDAMKNLNLTLADAGLTMRQQDDDALLRGYIDAQKVKSEDEGEARERGVRALEALENRLQLADERRKKDPILAEHRELEGPDG
jgi:hypothetical protein